MTEEDHFFEATSLTNPSKLTISVSCEPAEKLGARLTNQDKVWPTKTSVLSVTLYLL